MAWWAVQPGFLDGTEMTPTDRSVVATLPGR